MSWVNFPGDTPTGHGRGMYVQLVVLDREGRHWMECAGGYSRSSDDGVFVGWDREPDGLPSHPREWVYLAQVALGSTAWSGARAFTYFDLTEDGKAMYDLMKRLYGKGADVHLQTWVDA